MGLVKELITIRTYPAINARRLYVNDDILNWLSGDPFRRNVGEMSANWSEIEKPP
jgi:hypothetical protein